VIGDVSSRGDSSRPGRRQVDLSKRFVRTVLGDISADSLGNCDAHEHVIIDDPFVAETFPDFVLDDVDLACVDVAAFVAAGGRAMIDTMPMGCGRNIEKMVAVSRRTGCHLVCPTGLHLAIYYPHDHWTRDADVDRLTEWFIQDIRTGICADESVAPTRRTTHRAGVIKVAGSEVLTDFEKVAFRAAAQAHRQTGCPIITHTEGGRGADEQVKLFQDSGVDLRHVTLSHVDRTRDAGPHRRLLQSGVNLEYDGGFRWKNEVDNPTVRLMAELVPEFPGQIMVGMDAARRSYRVGYHGEPGLAWLMNRMKPMLIAVGLSEDKVHDVYVTNAAAAFSFAFFS